MRNTTPKGQDRSPSMRRPLFVLPQIQEDLSGSGLAVHRSTDVRNGQIVVARLGDEVTVKRWRRRARDVMLLAENPEFAPIIVDPRVTPLAIEGIGVGLIRGSSSL